MEAKIKSGTFVAESCGRASDPSLSLSTYLSFKGGLFNLFSVSLSRFIGTGSLLLLEVYLTLGETL